MNRIIILSLVVFFSNCKMNEIDSQKNMILIPGGSFFIGTDTSTAIKFANNNPTLCDFSWFTDQFPKHKVSIDTFYIDKYEVTIGEYEDFISATNYVSIGDWKSYYNFLKDSLKLNKNIRNFPIAGITWDDAFEYCNWKGKRLPTEAEWEYVAKGRTKDLAYPWGMYYDSSKGNVQNIKGPLPVGNFLPNSYGVFDLGGNVQEWCYDIYDKDYYAIADSINPKGPKEGLSRVVRGGSWYLNGKFYSRSATRSTTLYKDNYINLVGFRCAKNYKD